MNVWNDIYKDHSELYSWDLNILDPDFEIILKSYSASDTMVLDIGCGTGLQSIELAHRGFKVVSLDISQHACVILKEKASTCSLPIEIVVGDITRPCFRSAFTLVIDRG